MMRVRTSLVVCLAGLGGVNGQQGSMPTPQVQVNQVSTGKAGYTTYQVAVDFDGAVARDVYALFGEPNSPLIIPPGYQVATPFGTNVGPVNPAFFAVNHDAEFDSFLTIGLDGPSVVPGAISSVGIDFNAWTESNGMTLSDGAIFFMDPEHGATTEPVVFMQLTVPTGTQFSGQLSAQGRAFVGEDWESKNLQFSNSASPPPPPNPFGPPPPPPPPPPNPFGPPPPPPPAGNPCPACTNVALGRPATQSSTGWDGDPNRGVDGDSNTAWGGNTCTHTQNGSEEWWQVDLGASFDIQNVNIWHRSDCCQTRLLTATVIVSDTPDYSAGSVCGPIDDHLGEPDETACNSRGRYVTVVHHNEYITICELEVMAIGDPVVSAAACPNCINVAAGRPATQSSQGWGGDPSRGVDGDHNPVWAGNTCTHTQNGPEEWWQVDLGRAFDVQHVDIWHRSDCCETRLLTASVVVSMTPDYTTGLVCGPVDDHLGEPDETICNRRGQYVTVVHHNEYITICELEVLAIGPMVPPPPPPPGAPPAPPPPAPAPPGTVLANVAGRKPATQSSIGWDGDPNRGVDGDRNSVWGGNSCTHTQNGPTEWWQVDLGSSYDIQNVNIWHRSDCCETRLLTASVIVSDTPDYSGGINCGPVDDHLGEPDETLCNSRGRYVTVEHHSEYITICELEVMAWVSRASLPPPPPGGGGPINCQTAFSDNTQSYDTIFPEPLGPDKTVVFDVRASNDAHVGFFSETQDTGEVYEIVLSGWGNTRSAIREQNQGTNYADVQTPQLLSAAESRPFWASANNGLVVVGSGYVVGQNEIMRWQDPVAHLPMYVGVMCGWGSTATWNMCHAGWTGAAIAGGRPPPPPAYAAPADNCPGGLPTAYTTYKFNLDPDNSHTGLRDWAGANSIQLAEVTLYDIYGTPLLDGLTCTNPDGDNPGGELPEHACDGLTADDPNGCSGCANTGHKWLDFNKGDLVLTFESPQQVGSWDWQTANDAPPRDPVTWRLEGSNDGTSWNTLDDTNAQTPFPTTEERFTWQGPFRVACDPTDAGGGCSGSFSIASDNAYALYINGEYQSNVNGGVTNVAGCDTALTPSGDPYTGCNWQSVDLHEFTNIPGPVTLAVDALDAGGAGGWIGTAIIDGFEYSTSAASDWKCWTPPEESHGQDGGSSQVNSGWHGDPPPYGWARQHFDDTTWYAPTSFGVNGVAPWGDVNRDMGMNSAGTVSPTAEWIWTSDNQAHNDIYCRLTVPCGRPAGPAAPPPPAQIPHTLEGATAISVADPNWQLSGSAVLDGDVISLTQVVNSQQGFAFYPIATTAADDFTVQFQMYTGDGSGADGMCVNIGSNDMTGRNGEDGVAEGVAVCFDEWANSGDHGVSIFYNGAAIWENIAPCGNREGCIPVSLFEDSVWHVVEVNVAPAVTGAVVTFDFDNGAYGGFGLANGYTLPQPAFLGFTARTGGATNNHFVKNINTGGAWLFPPPPPPLPPLPVSLSPSQFEVTGSTQVVGDVLQLTQVEGSQTGTAFVQVGAGGSDFKFTTRFEMYTGDGSGADGQCVNIGNNDLGGRVAENGVTRGVAVCFDEWANAGDHGVAIYWNAGNAGDGSDSSRDGVIWENIAPCNNRENCIPVSLYDDATWHTMEVTITPMLNFGAQVRFSMDNGRYSGFGDIQYGFSMPTPTYLGFTARTGGATNNHWVRRVTTSRPPPPPLPTIHHPSSFTLDGSAMSQGDVIKLTQVANSQQGTAFKPIDLTAADPFSVRYWLYTGDGSGADGQCVNIGGNDMAGRVGEDGVGQGVAVCFDEWANNGDHGVSIFYNGAAIWENIALCSNREMCVPVSLYDDAAWHVVEVGIVPSAGGATVTFSFDNGVYGGFGTVERYSLPAQVYLGFSARTGGATNNHWVRGISSGTGADAHNLEQPAGALAPDLANPVSVDHFVLDGSAMLDGDVLSITQLEGSQAGTAFYPLSIRSSDRFHVQFQMYCGDGSGADGLCVNIGGNDMGGRVGEDGVASGVAVCFDEWANNGDHGVTMFYNGGMIWEEIGTCDNRENCAPVSLFDDATWHQVKVDLFPSKRGTSAEIVFDFDNGRYGGFGDVDIYALPQPAYLGFSGRTGGATNNHWVKSISTSLPQGTASVSGRTCDTQEMGGLAGTYCPTVPTGAVIPATCPPGCAAVMLPWYRACSQTTVFTASDAVLGGILTAFSITCANPPAPPPPPPPPAPARIPHQLEGASPVDMARFALSGSALLTTDVLQLTQTETSQQGFAFIPAVNAQGRPLANTDDYTVGYEMYTGDGSGADGQCVNIGSNDMTGRNGEDGVAEGVAVCFDEWANSGDHGVSIFYNGAAIWENIGLCDNRENCIPVSLYEDAAWHVVEVNIAPTAAGGAVVTFDFDSGAYGGFGLADGYTLPQPAYLGFTARTGGATNNHWVRNVNTGGAWVFPPPPPPPPPLPVPLGVDQFALSGSSVVVGNVLQLTQTETDQTGTAFAQIAAAPGDDFQMTVRYEMYTGDGSGADGQCVNIGNNDLMGRAGEDGVAEGVAVCFDEWANSGDHGVTIFYNSAPIWENIAPCNNRENCIPVSLYDDAAWHTVEVKISPLFDGSAQVSFSLDNGMYSGFGQVIRYLDDGFTLPSPTYLGFTARTGGATNNHWVRNVATSSPAPPPYENTVSPRAMTLGGSSLQVGDVVQLTQVAGSQTGTAFAPIPGGLRPTDPIAVRYWMYTGDGSGADGQCVNIGNNDLGGRVAENGVTRGVAVCFDEWANAGDHGVAIYWNAGNAGDGSDSSRDGAIWENIAPCNNRENCIPVSLFDDAAWHVVDVAVLPNQGGAQVVFNFDNGIYGGFGTISGYSMPSPAYIGFTARTGGATNNHWIRDVSFSTQQANAAALVRASAPAPPAPPLANQMAVSQFTLSGSAVIDGLDTISLTQDVGSQQGTAFSQVQIGGRDDFSVQYSMYCGGGTGADGMCVNVGSNDMGGRVGEDGVSIGVAVCFDEWANNGDHGVSIFYNGGMIWENIALCDNRANCVPVSLFDDAAWHQVRVDIAPAKRGNAAQVVFDFDNGAYGGYGDIVNYNLVAPAYLGFSARTGGATNNHWVKDISTSAPTAPASDGCGAADISAITETYCPATRDPNAIVPSVCPPGCATRLTPWFRSCASSQTFRQLDMQLGRDLTRFQALCASSVRGPPAGGGH